MGQVFSADLGLTSHVTCIFWGYVGYRPERTLLRHFLRLPISCAHGTLLPYSDYHVDTVAQLERAEHGYRNCPQPGEHGPCRQAGFHGRNGRRLPHARPASTKRCGITQPCQRPCCVPILPVVHDPGLVELPTNPSLGICKATASYGGPRQLCQCRPCTPGQATHSLVLTAHPRPCYAVFGVPRPADKDCHEA